MKHWLVMLAWICICTNTQAASNVELFAAAQDLSSVRISPKGDFLSAIKTVELEDTEKDILVIFNYPQMTLSTTLALPENRSVGSYFWANPERVVARGLIDVKRNDHPFWIRGRYAINADGSEPATLLGSRILRVVSYMLEDPKRILVARYGGWGTRADVDFGTLNIYNGGYGRIARSRLKNATIVADAYGNVRFSVAENDDLSTVIQSFDQGTRRWAPHSTTQFLKGAPIPISINRDGTAMTIRAATDKGPLGIYELDIKSNERSLIYKHDKADSIPLTDRTGHIWATRHESGYGETTILDSDHPLTQVYTTVAPAFADQTVSIQQATTADLLDKARTSLSWALGNSPRVCKTM